MFADLSDLILTPSTLLWFVAALIAATLLFGSINRRRSRLTDTLRDYVDRGPRGARESTFSDDDRKKPGGGGDKS